MSQAADGLGRRAVRAAVEVAAHHGVRVRDPVVLKDSFNAVVWLRPAPVVARVVLVPAVLRSNVDDLVERELAVTEFLDRRGLCVTRPSAELPPGPHRRDGLWMSFWQRLEVEEAALGSDAGAQLRRLHTALRDFPVGDGVLDVPARRRRDVLSASLRISRGIG